jgi:hypothetical protein
MVDCGSAGVWDRGIKGMCNVFMGSEVYCLLFGDEYYGGVFVELYVGHIFDTWIKFGICWCITRIVTVLRGMLCLCVS